MSVDLGLLIIRVVIGLILAAHGAQKMFGWFEGPGLAGMAGWLGSIRLRPAFLWAFLAAASELGGGLLLALGLLGPVGALGIIAAMVVAILAAHAGSFFNQKNGMEFPLTLALVALGLAVSGPGAYSLDAFLGLSLPEPLTLLAGLVLVVIGVALTFGTRAPAKA